MAVAVVAAGLAGCDEGSASARPTRTLGPTPTVPSVTPTSLVPPYPDTPEGAVQAAKDYFFAFDNAVNTGDKTEMHARALDDCGQCRGIEGFVDQNYVNGETIRGQRHSFLTAVAVEYTPQKATVTMAADVEAGQRLSASGAVVADLDDQKNSSFEATVLRRGPTWLVSAVIFT